MIEANLTGVDVRSQVDMAVAKKSLDAMKDQGNAMTDLIAQAGEVAKASRGAVSPTPGPGETGGRLDTTG
jgi:hypothetical protein